MMKRLVCASLFALAIASPAAGQEQPAAAAPAAAPAPIQAVTACGPIPEPPKQPDIAKERDTEVVNKFTKQLNDFIATANTNLDCRRTAIKAENEALLARKAAIDAAADSYKADVASLQTVVDQWKADVDAFNARQKPTRGR